MSPKETAIYDTLVVRGSMPVRDCRVKFADYYAFQIAMSHVKAALKVIGKTTMIERDESRECIVYKVIPA